MAAAARKARPALLFVGAKIPKSAAFAMTGPSSTLASLRCHYGIKRAGACDVPYPDPPGEKIVNAGETSFFGDGTFGSIARLCWLNHAAFAVIGFEEPHMSLGTILVIVLILVLLGVFPRGGRRSYGPSGIVGVILVIVVILLLLGRI